MSIIHDALKKAQSKKESGISYDIESSAEPVRAGKTSNILIGMAIIGGVVAMGVIGYKLLGVVKNRDRGAARQEISFPVPPPPGAEVHKSIRPAQPGSESSREDTLARQGERYFWLGDLKNSEQMFRQALEAGSAPKAELLNNLGLVLSKKGQLKEALDLYDTALRYDPALAEALSNRGVVLRKLKRYEDARKDLEKALEIVPDFGHAQFNLATVHEALGETMKAITYYRKYLDNRSRPPGLDEVLILQRISALEADASNASLSFMKGKKERQDH